MQFDDAGTGRYRLLETVRQYAAGQLDALGLAAAGAAWTAHRDHYLALAEAAAPQLVAADQAEWLDRLDAELGNLRAAIAFSVPDPDPAPGLRLAASLRVYWQVRGHAAEGADVLRALLEAPAAQGATLLRARALAAAANLLVQTDGYATAGDYCQEGLAIAAPSAMSTWSPTCCKLAPGPCCAGGSPTSRCRSSSRAWAWPDASRSPT